MSVARIRKNDTVVVRAGRDRGRRGRVLAVWPDERRILVEKVNVVKRATKANPRSGQGGLIEKEAPIPASRAMLVCGRCGKPTRPAVKALPDGRRARACRKCGETNE